MAGANCTPDLRLFRIWRPPGATGFSRAAPAPPISASRSQEDPGAGENGPASLTSKDDIVKYLKDAIAYGHKAMNSLTAQNISDLVQSAFGDNKVPRMSMASLAVWHSFDHYGQMVVYARMNGIIPPASRQ